MEITIREDKCIGCGMCAYAAPEVFRIVGQYSTVIAQPEGDNARKAFNAATGCPVNAIKIKR